MLFWCETLKAFLTSLSWIPHHTLCQNRKIFYPFNFNKALKYLTSFLTTLLYLSTFHNNSPLQFFSPSFHYFCQQNKHHQNKTSKFTSIHFDADPAMQQPQTSTSCCFHNRKVSFTNFFSPSVLRKTGWNSYSILIVNGFWRKLASRRSYFYYICQKISLATPWKRFPQNKNQNLVQ